MTAKIGPSSHGITVATLNDYVMNAAPTWAAHPHQFGPGKVHLLAEDGMRTVCGQDLAKCPGSKSTHAADCKTCLKSEAASIRNAEATARWQQIQSEREREQREWWAKYDAYLQTEKWRRKSLATIKRAGGVCEGCGVRKATQAHHLTYRHVFDEFLWELRAVCGACHDRAHEDAQP